jgi:dolichol kinase
MPDILIYRKEVYRKIVHIASCTTIAILLCYFGKEVFLPWILPVAISFPIIDYSRKYIPLIKRLSFTLFGIITRRHEHHTLSGASWVFIGAGFTVYIFNEQIALIALLVIGLSDSAAALIGIKYGATRLFNKSLEGSLAFFITTYLIIFFLSSSSFLLLLIATISATAIELLSTPKLNDNVLIPISTALILSIGGIN